MRFYNASKILITLLLLMPGFLSNAQEEDKKFGASLYGYVKNDLYFDSRQTLAAREGFTLFWPKPEQLDAAGEDLNDKFNFNMLAIQTRFGIRVNGPDAFGAKTSGLIEADFFAQANANINLVRMRHAYIKLNWTNTELLAGQFWNPLFTTVCYPGVVSFNTGLPIQPFARNPQLRLTQTFGDMQLVVAALSQRDHASPGGPATLRNAGFPDMHLQLRYNSNSVFAGVGGAYKQIIPSIQTATGYKTTESVGGLSLMGFLKLQTNGLTFKIKETYGQNLYDMLNISTFAITGFSNDIYAYPEYTPIQNNSIWAEIHTNGSKFQTGIFGGYNQNLGASEEIIPGTIEGGGRGVDKLHYILRVSPRVVFISNKTKIAAEIEYTGAAFAENLNDYDEKGKITNSKYYANTRVLLSILYAF